MIRIEWTEPAVSDLENIHEYIARDSAEYADAVVERLVLSVDRLASFPESGRLVPEASDPKIRELLSQNYRVIYRLRKGVAQILAIVLGARNLSGIKPKPWVGQ
ncbi:type II toxin-antitoxin system RelE/ParE family toxin [Nitrospira sp. BLG_1]|uniref:type II toxin-antitoxin system RelE/ParE family toxin n=1 Tax=Nitrospira sp. BLG_1 TaxID=3395883 RepID=UPI0039BCC93C